MESHLSSVLAFGLPGGTEWVVILVIGLLLFGRRLPEVGKSIGQGIREFKKGLKETEDEVKGDNQSQRRNQLPQDRTMPGTESAEEKSKAH